AHPVEQLLADHVLEPADLSADGGLGQTELGAGADDAAIPGDGPEVEQVMVVEPLHGTRPRPGPPNYIGIFDDARSIFRIVYDCMRRYPSKMPQVCVRAATALVLVALLTPAMTVRAADRP